MLHGDTFAIEEKAGDRKCKKSDDDETRQLENGNEL
jgi:hypothetical protein